MRSAAPIESVEVKAFTIPTDAPEADGTLHWEETTLVLVRITAGGRTGLGFTYTSPTVVPLIQGKLAELLSGRDALDVPASWAAMVGAVRNMGRHGLAANAIAALDVGLWDLKARLLDVSLAKLLGMAHPRVPVYGSGGFTSYSDEQLREQFTRWAGQGITRFKMKVGEHPGADPARVRAAREIIGPDAVLMVDANGAYARKEALALAEIFAQQRVVWFEEPVSSEDLEGLRLLRDRAPAGMAITAGEYGYDSRYFRRMLLAGAVDVLQADATRCLGITGFLHAAAVAAAFEVPLSPHTAPAIHLHAACAIEKLAPIEWFHDHARIEAMLFDGAPDPRDGVIEPDLARPGLGLELKEADAAPFAH